MGFQRFPCHKASSSLQGNVHKDSLLHSTQRKLIVPHSYINHSSRNCLQEVLDFYSSRERIMTVLLLSRLRLGMTLDRGTCWLESFFYHSQSFKSPASGVYVTCHGHMLLWYIHLAHAVESAQFLSTLPILFLAILFLSGSKESWEYILTGALFYSFLFVCFHYCSQFSFYSWSYSNGYRVMNTQL